MLPKCRRLSPNAKFDAAQVKRKLRHLDATARALDAQPTIARGEMRVGQYVHRRIDRSKRHLGAIELLRDLVVGQMLNGLLDALDDLLPPPRALAVVVEVRRAFPVVES